MKDAFVRKMMCRSTLLRRDSQLARVKGFHDSFCTLLSHSFSNNISFELNSAMPQAHNPVVFKYYP